MSIYHPKKIQKFNRYSYEDIKIGERVAFHDGKEAVWLKIIRKSDDSRELMIGEICFYQIFSSKYKLGDEIVISPEYIFNTLEKQFKT